MFASIPYSELRAGDVFIRPSGCFAVAVRVDTIEPDAHHADRLRITGAT